MLDRLVTVISGCFRRAKSPKWKLFRARRDFARKEANPEAVERALEYIATQIRAIADFLDDHDVQEGIAVVGRTTDPLALAPRSPARVNPARQHKGDRPHARER